MIATSQASTSPALPTCPICQGDIVNPKDSWSHKGGEAHPFHKECIRQWARINPTCPIDRGPIDQDSLRTCSERVLCTAKNALTQILYAGLTGGAVVASLSSINHNMWLGALPFFLGRKFVTVSGPPHVLQIKSLLTTAVMALAATTLGVVATQRGAGAALSSYIIPNLFVGPLIDLIRTPISAARDVVLPKLVLHAEGVGICALIGAIGSAVLPMERAIGVAGGVAGVFASRIQSGVASFLEEAVASAAMTSAVIGASVGAAGTAVETRSASELEAVLSRVASGAVAGATVAAVGGLAEGVVNVAEKLGGKVAGVIAKVGAVAAALFASFR